MITFCISRFVRIFFLLRIYHKKQILILYKKLVYLLKKYIYIKFGENF